MIRVNLKYSVSCIITTLFLIHFSFSQNIEKIGKKDMVKVNGGINVNSILYKSNGIVERREPFSYFVSGNLNISVLDVSIPLTYSYSNQQSKFTQPFNRLSLNPYYKKVKTYIGYNSITFSPYTLNGYVFLGGGVEVNPGNWKVTGLYGRFRKAVPYDIYATETMSYKRLGYGAKVGYEHNGQSIAINMFSAKDDVNSLDFTPVNASITPEANTAVSVQGKTTLWKQLTVEAEYALSGYTRNILAASDLEDQKNKLPFLKPQSNTQYFNAYKTAIRYRYNIVSIQLQYEHVDPDYKTLGAYYFNNDLENYTIVPSVQLLKGTLNLSLNTGLQRNNLDKNKMATTKRWVNSLTASYAPTQSWIFTGMYSNFNSFTKNNPVITPLTITNPQDTLNFYQLSQNANASITHMFGSQTRKQNVMLMANYMVSAQAAGAFTDASSKNLTGTIPAKIYNSNASYSISFIPTKTTISVIANLNKVDMKIFSTLFYGPGLNISKPIYREILTATLGSTFNESTSNGKSTGKVFSHRAGFSYNPKLKNQNWGRFNAVASLMLLQKLSTANFTEFTGTVSLGYSF